MGQKPTPSDVLQILFDKMPLLSDTFFSQSGIDDIDTTDQQTAAIRLLQMRIRMHTQEVRNWGYFSDVLEIATDLYCPLDANFSAFHEFSIRDLIEVMQSVANEFEHRVDEHFKVLQQVSLGKNAKDVIERYYKSIPTLAGTPADMLAVLPPRTGRKEAAIYVMAEMDKRLVGLATFRADEVAALTGRTTRMVETVLRAVSLPPGNLIGTNPQHLFS